MSTLNIQALFTKNFCLSDHGITPVEVISRKLEESSARTQEFLLEKGVQIRLVKSRLLAFGVAPRLTQDTSREDLSIVKSSDNPGIYFVTAACARAEAHMEFLAAIDTFCLRHNAELVILPSMAHIKALEDQPSGFCDEIRNRSEAFATEYRFNRFLVAHDAMILPQQAQPLTGMDRYAKRDQSVIIASPKQHLDTVAVASGEYPKILTTTGVCTYPDYQDNRIGRIAREEHVIGGLIVEITADGWFHIRHVQAQEDGSFISMGIKYTADGACMPVRAEAMVIGDVHATQVSDTALDAVDEIQTRVKAHKAVLHDLFDGYSCNPHDKGRAVTRARKANLTLAQELSQTGGVVEAIKSKFEEVLIVPSNHDDMLNRYLESGDWVHDSRNAAIANVLFGYALRGANPLEELFKAEGVKFLDENSHEAIAGFVVSEHGHRAVGGAKGSAAGFRRCAPHVVGHSHAPKARSNFLQTGCICKLRQGYNKGLSDWAHAVVNLYEDQQWELIIIINGKFTGMTL